MVLNPVNATIPFTPREDVPSASASKSTLVSQMDTDQRSLFYFAVFDGHGGSNTADYLTANLDRHIEECTPDIIPGVVRSLRQLGGYFRNFYPSYLKPYLTRNFDQLLSATKSSQLDDQPFNKSKESLVRSMNFSPHLNTVEEQDENAASFKAQVAKQTGEETTEQKHFKWLRRKQLTNDISCTHHHAPFESPTMARTKAGLTSSASATGGDNPKQPPIPLPPELADDNHPLPPMTLEQRLYLAFLQCDTELIQNKFRDGSTASVVLLQSKGAFWETDADLELVLGHVGDTRVLLCEAPHGQCVQLSTDHHPDATTETDRIRRLSGYVTQDSFGENMFLGRLANTRSFGDVALKPFGVSAEPEVVRRTLKATQAAFLVLISDGISSVMSNQEIVDCVKLESDPTQAATNVLNLAEQLGAEDNCTVLVVRLPAWGTPMPDLSRELREYRWQSEAL
ncbi:hypothetical protein BGW41_000733, partial [Actinomortierella wolfii]